MEVRLAYGASEGASLVGSDGPIVVIDALRMSATVIVACSRGMEVLPVATAAEALAWKSRGALTAGERNGVKIPELDLGNSPRALLQLTGGVPRLLALTTSNGVPALLSVAAHPQDVLIGSPLNLSALATHIRRISPHSLGILIAGRRGAEAAEDEMTAALILERIGVTAQHELPAPPPLDELESYFARTHSGRKLAALGYAQDVSLCARADLYPIIPRLDNTGEKPIIRAYEVNHV